MTTRRELFKFAGGSAMGLLLTPAPWRLITDTALWSENWPGVPRPARGEIRAKFTHCGLCAAGCAVRARCVGEQPVSLAGVDGGLCPFGVTGHHLPYHPERLRQGSAKEAAAAVAAVATRGSVAVLDLRPGRTASWTYRRAMAALPNGVYVAAEEPACMVNLAAARTVLSLGAPLLDGWGRPNRVFAARPNFRLIHAEAVESRTAALADEWLAVRPGTEAVLGRAVAGTISARQAAEIAGLAVEQVAQLARALREDGPALILAPQMTSEVLGWNLQLGGWGKTVLPRREPPVPKEWKTAAPVTRLAAVPDGSLRALLIDESVPGAHVPWAEIQPKLAPDAVVVAFAWSRDGYAQPCHTRPADRCVPRSVGRSAGGRGFAPVAEFRLTVPLTPARPMAWSIPRNSSARWPDWTPRRPCRSAPRPSTRAAVDVLRTYADGKSTAVKETRFDDFWKALNAGGCWTDEVRDSGNAPKPGDSSAPADDPVGLWPFRLAIDGPESAGLLSPLMGKLSQESRLRLGTHRAAMHPRCGFEDGARAAIETPYGRCSIQVALDAGVPPGVVLVAGRPDIADIRSADGRARVVRI